MAEKSSDFCLYDVSELRKMKKSLLLKGLDYSRKEIVKVRMNSAQDKQHKDINKLRIGRKNIARLITVIMERRFKKDGDDGMVDFYESSDNKVNVKKWELIKNVE